MDLFLFLCFFFFNDTATTEIYTLSLHDALPISLSVETAVYTKIESQRTELGQSFGIFVDIMTVVNHLTFAVSTLNPL